MASRPTGPRLDLPLGSPTTLGASRCSPLFPELRLIHADLHNHSHLSDGAGDPAEFHAAARAAGLDAAALTDHAIGGLGRRDYCALEPTVVGHVSACRTLRGLTDEGWHAAKDLARAADAPGRYTAIPGFEWSSAHLGHVNVWFGEVWTDAMATGGVTEEGLLRIGLSLERFADQLLTDFADVITRSEVTDIVTAIRDREPAGMRPFYDWLARQPEVGALTGFNHPYRESASFDDFASDPRRADRMVTVELFNKCEDFLFRGVAAGGVSPLVACLDAGWRVGIIGTSDEHGARWRNDEGKGRTGVWVRRLDRSGLREALLCRRVFATREAGLRLAASADGVPMGGTVPPRREPVTFDVDIDLGPSGDMRPVTVQVLRPGRPAPVVAEQVTGIAGGRGTGVAPIRIAVALSRDDGEWVVLRISDPSASNEAPAPFEHPANDRALAYSSPWWLGPRGRGTAS